MDVDRAVVWNDLFEQARALGVAAHGAQRYGDEPYEVHLRAVVGVLVRFGASLDDGATAPLLVGAWLHDSIEDTSLTRDEIERRLGPEIAELVWRVTDEPAATRKERKLATYPKIRGSEAAILLKLADRIANVEASRAGNSGLLRMYAGEHGDLKEWLEPASRCPMAARMWRHLDELLADAR
ncbi:MAG: bifunctional (p)ppGpp synthetase/guanosine-3',5'-bis(diphosphate) 3'-pyrophosphohydrolase [Polyangiaceae bacterium]|nr:bifunctional (p)ppGpp synthetase/guanosine-3',5'-bis(diphosphate) 3'-pyrophosphohydrolase [Polyangiaceae bacterium]